MRDEVQVARWDAIRGAVARRLRALRKEGYSQARLAWDLEDLGFRVSQSMISRYEQGLGQAPLSLERLAGWALCCNALSSRDLQELLELTGYHLPWSREDLARFDDLLRHYRGLSEPDQIVLRRRLLWHILGLDPDEPAPEAPS